MTRPMIRIVIADRYDVVRRGVKLLVEGLNYYRVVGEAADGREALRLVRDTTPNIVIIDLSLPELNGVELTHHLRRMAPKTEVLVFANENRERAILDVLRAGAKGVVLKTDPDHNLVAALDSLSIHRPYFSEKISEVLLDRFLHSQPEGMESCLTHREREVVQLIAEGRINKQIGHALDIAVKTVECHRASAMHKLNLRTTADLVRYAIRNDMVQA